MRLVFMGTPDFALATLQALIAAGHEIACVYSQPPRQAGRGMALRPSPIQAFAETQKFEVRTPLSLKSPEEQQRFAELKADAGIVVAYGLLLPQAVLSAPALGYFNVHASLLPRWRGAAPIQRAIMAGDAESGVTIMRMEAGLDTGPMLAVAKVPITADTTAATLHDELAEVGARLLVDVLSKPLGPGVAQPGDGVTYARKIDKAEAHIDFQKSAIAVRNHIHGLSPFPGAWFSYQGQRIKVLKAGVVEGSGVPGSTLDDQLTIACGLGAVQVLELHREGKAAMSAAELLRGLPIPKLTELN